MGNEGKNEEPGFLCVFCREAETDEAGRLNIHGIFNELHAPAFPARQKRMVLVCVVDWPHRTSGRISFRVDLLDIEGQPIFTVEGHTDVTSAADDRPPPQTQFVLPMENVMFVKAGRYTTRITIQGMERAGASLYLNEAPAGAAGTRRKTDRD